MEDHHVHDVTACHAQRQGNEHEDVRNLSVQGWRRQNAAEVQELQPEVHDRAHLHDRGERFGPRHRQSVQHAEHLEEGHQLAADCGAQLARDDAIHAPEKCQCDDDGANQHAQRLDRCTPTNTPRHQKHNRETDTAIQQKHGQQRTKQMMAKAS